MSAGDAADRRVLVLAPFPPRLDGRHGGSRAVAHLVAGLAARNRVALAYLRAQDEPPADPALAGVCDRVLEGRRPGIASSSVRPWPGALGVLPAVAAGKPLWVAARWSPSFAARLRELAADWRPDVVQAEFSAMGQYFAVLDGCGGRRVVTVHEPGAGAARERAAGSPPLLRAVWSADARLWERFEAGVLAAAAAAVVFSERDRTAVDRLHPGVRTARIPLAVPLPPAPADPVGGAPPGLLFVGSFVHPPNLEAALHLATEVFPPLRVRFPGVRLYLVGEAPPRELLEVAGEGVEVTGWVPDLAPYLERAAVVVAPVRKGGGMRVKVAEALGAGKAVVATPLALEGLAVVPGTHALVAGSTADFVAAVAALLADPARRAALGRAARAWALEHLGPDRTAAAYEVLYDSLPGDRSVTERIAEAAR